MEHKQQAAYQMLMLIATHKLADKAAEMFLQQSLPIQYRANAEGTASSEIMDTLGFGSVDKCLLVSTVPHEYGREMLRQLHTKLRLDAINSGIAFTVPLTGATNHVVRMMNAAGEQNASSEHGKGDFTMMNNYTLIAAIVDRGFSSEVMDAARAAGAGGGTVVHSRGIQSEQATAAWGLSVQEEKEIVLILAELDKKIDIMSAVSDKCGMHSEAKGTVISLPVDAVMGI